jgi:hypothetical protein
MKQLILTALLTSILVFGASSQAHAFLGVAASAAAGYDVKTDDHGTDGITTGGEIMVFYSLLKILKFDLAFPIDFRAPTDFFEVRPGIRVQIPKFIYGRVAVPITIDSNDVFPGLMLGIGYNFIDVPMVKLFGEIDTRIMGDITNGSDADFSFGDSIPVEARIGVEFGF